MTLQNIKNIEGATDKKRSVNVACKQGKIEFDEGTGCYLCLYLHSFRTCNRKRIVFLLKVGRRH